MAAEIGRRREHAVDWSSRTNQEQVLAYLYQKLVRYEERTVRFAVRLDKSEDDESRDFVHPLVRALASDGGRDRSLYWLSGRFSRRRAPSSGTACHRVRAAAAALRQPHALRGISSPDLPRACLPLLQESQTTRLEPVAPAGQAHGEILLAGAVADVSPMPHP